MPGLSTTNAVTASPHSVSGSPSTATSPTAGCAAITSSTSFGMMLDAPERMTSFSRPTMDRRPSSSNAPMSPVCSQPSRSASRVASSFCQ